MLRIIFAAFLWLISTGANAQTSPNLTFGEVLTPAQWNQLFINKNDTLGFTPLNTAGGIMTGRLVTAPPSSTTAGFNFGCGSTPASPVNGDTWCTSAGLFVQINGTTIGPLGGATSSSFAATSPITVSFPSGITTYACGTCGVTGSPLSQFAATTSAQLAGVISNETGTGLLVFNNAPALTSPVLTTPVLGVAAGTSLALGGATIGSNALAVTGTFAFSAGGSFGGAITGITTLASGAHTITSASANALAVGLAGTTNPAFNVDASTASSATGINIKSAAAGGGVALAAISSGTNEALSINAKGSGAIAIGSVSTGAVTITPATTLSAALTYGGVTLANSVTGTGSMVLAAAPSVSSLTVTTALTATGLVTSADIATAVFATSANVIAGTSTSTLIPPSAVYSAETTTTFGATTTFDFSTFINTAVTLTGNITTQTLSNVKAGQAGQIRFIQDGTGSRTTVWNSVFKFTGGVTPLLSTAAGAIDVLFYSCISSTLCYAGLNQNMK
jgi:hypothetical protein